MPRLQCDGSLSCDLRWAWNTDLSSRKALEGLWLWEAEAAPSGREGSSRQLLIQLQEFQCTLVATATLSFRFGKYYEQDHPGGVKDFI